LLAAMPTVLLAATCFAFALAFEGSQLTDAAGVAVVAAGGVGPAGSSSVAGELSALGVALRALVFGRRGQESASLWRNA